MGMEGLRTGHVLVCVTGQKTCESLIIEGARIAKEENAPMTVLHVVKPGAALLGSQAEGEALEYLLRIATEYDADMAMIRSDDIVGTIAHQAEKLNADVLLMGRTTGSKGRSISARMAERLPELKVRMDEA